MALLAFLALSVTVGLWIFLESMILISAAFFIFMTTKGSLTIVFRDNTLTLQENPIGKIYQFDDLTRSSFKLKQTKGQKKLNLGDARIIGYPWLAIYDIKNYSEFVEYIETNLK